MAVSGLDTRRGILQDEGMTTNEAFQDCNGVGDELGYDPEPEQILATVYGVGTVYRIILEYIGESTGRFSVTVISGPGSMALIDRSQIVFTTADDSELSWVAAMMHVALASAKEVQMESTPGPVALANKLYNEGLLVIPVELPMDPTGVDCAERYDGIDA